MNRYPGNVVYSQIDVVDQDSIEDDGPDGREGEGGGDVRRRRKEEEKGGVRFLYHDFRSLTPPKREVSGGNSADYTS